MWRPAYSIHRPLIRHRLAAMPPSPLWGEGFTRGFTGFLPSGGKLSSEARLMRGRTVEHRADIIRPYGTPQERTYSCKRSPHPPQRARWGTFPQGKA